MASVSKGNIFVNFFLAFMSSLPSVIRDCSFAYARAGSCKADEDLFKKGSVFYCNCYFLIQSLPSLFSNATTPSSTV